MFMLSEMLNVFWCFEQPRYRVLARYKFGFRGNCMPHIFKVKSVCLFEIKV